MMETKRIRPDAKGRIPLGSLADGVSSFSITLEGDKIILQPYTEIPSSEKWLFDNKPALHSLKKGLSQLEGSSLISKGSFTKYTDDDVK